MKAIDSSVKSRVIKLFKQGKQYAEIVKILRQQGIQVSFGSCWNIVASWKKQQGQGQESVVHVSNSTQSNHMTSSIPSRNLSSRGPLAWCIPRPDIIPETSV